MSDVPVAPPGGAPTAAPSPQTSQGSANPSEVVVDQNPVQTPHPVGSQAPDKPDAERRRESIQKAFDKAVKQQEAGEARKPPPNRSTATPKAAEAKAGHNQPPEQTPPEKVQYARGERGQFAPRVNQNQSLDPQQNAQGVPKGTTGTSPEGSIPILPEHAPYRDPPARLAEHARKDWAATPESVRGETHRMHNEFARAHAFYKAGHEAFQPIKRFHDMAQEHGTTLEKALTSYTGMEAKLREDVVAGLDTIVNNLRLTTPDGQPIGLRDISYHVLSQSPEQLRQIQQGNQQTAAASQIGALHQEVLGLKQAMQQWQTAQQFTYTRSAVDQFADSHPRFDELGEAVNQELKLGFSLEEAYRRAELLRPATQAAQTRDPSAQTRTDRSISGAPSGGPASGHADRTPRKNGPAPSRRESIQRAINRVQGTSH